MTTTDILLWVALPYVTIAVLVTGSVWRYRYDKFGWTTRSSQIYGGPLLRIASPLFHFGILAVVALGLAIWGFQFLKGINVLKTSKTFYVRYQNVDQLRPSAPVFINGFQVGMVKDLYVDSEDDRTIIAVPSIHVTKRARPLHPHPSLPCCSCWQVIGLVLDGQFYPATLHMGRYKAGTYAVDLPASWFADGCHDYYFHLEHYTLGKHGAGACLRDQILRRGTVTQLLP